MFHWLIFVWLKVISWKILPTAKVPLKIWSIKIFGNFEEMIVECWSWLLNRHPDNSKWIVWLFPNRSKINWHCRDVCWSWFSSKRDVCKQNGNCEYDRSTFITKNSPSFLINKIEYEEIYSVIYPNRSVEPINSNRLSQRDNEHKTNHWFISVSCIKNGPGIWLTKSYNRIQDEFFR